MRADFDRVLIERPRYGSSLGNQKTGGRVRNEDAVATRVPMSLKDKELNDLLGPLWRYLQSNVGRPWDKVYSEICAVADARGIRGYHLRRHVLEEVQWRFRVHPRTGILMRRR